MRRFLVAIDGPAGAGKSTVARKVADCLGITYVDTGAMYRAIAWKALNSGIDIMKEEEVAQLAESLDISLHPEGICINDHLLKNEIRTPEITSLASVVAKMPKVRRVLVNKQQQIAEHQSVVMDGRDIGTNVLPCADVKIFLTASIEERALRRYKEMKAKGMAVELEQLKAELQKRDENDCTREIAPLKQAEDAVLIDSTHHSVTEIVEKILHLCRNKLGDKE
ncbi:(d)CMP kinase [Thermoactinomyces mirandus]|uniref:Cytidylate kinase n=1 Tax=Thermoactinomyces mirandus TaxID=2756294 RepID=A0A7W1XV14_9BACL|nr:(d)CMP kinase [Thermoactinomyces mirandus]MBA4603706.1 (d)CMP kinase [Thermoactinomyces mirandus]